MIPLYAKRFSNVFQHSDQPISAKLPTFTDRSIAALVAWDQASQWGEKQKTRSNAEPCLMLQLFWIAYSFKPTASANGQRKALQHALSGIFFRPISRFSALRHASILLLHQCNHAYWANGGLLATWVRFPMNLGQILSNVF